MKNKITALIIFIAALLLAGFKARAEQLQCGETKTESQETVSSVEVVTDTPKHLKGATITITKVDGTSEVVKAEEYMVVKRKHKRPVVNMATTTQSLSCKTEVVDSGKKNIISVQAVNSQAGLDKKTVNPTTVEVKTETDLGTGVLYQRKLDATLLKNNLIIGIGADTNKGVSLGLGMEF